jgi:hypothetical protein
MVRRWPGGLFLLGLILVLSIRPALGAQSEAKDQITAIYVRFKIQSVTKENSYMGELWVANTQFADAQVGEKYVGYARAVGLDAAGKGVDLTPVWQPSDPAMVQVTPNPGHIVKVTVLKAGQSELTVTAGGFSKKLLIKAAYQDKVIHVKISQ